MYIVITFISYSAVAMQMSIFFISAGGDQRNTKIERRRSLTVSWTFA